MRPLSDVQRDFAAAVLDPGLEIPAGLTGPAARRPLRRFGVYRNNVHASLIDVLQCGFRVVARLLGEEFFRATARDFVGGSLPANPRLMTYGADFPAFLEGYGPVQDLPWLGDIARLEWAWNEAYHAADMDTISAAELADVSADAADGLILRLHPSLRLVRSAWPVLSIWEANQAEGEVPEVGLGLGPEDALVVRPRLSVEVRRLPPGGADFIAALASGERLGAAAGCAEQASDTFSFEVNFAGLLRCGAVTGFQFERSGQTGKARE